MFAPAIRGIVRNTQRHLPVTLGVAGVVLFLTLWQLVVSLGHLNPTAFADVPATGAALLHLVRTQTLWASVAATLQSWSLAMLIGAGMALAVGTAAGLSKAIHKSVALSVEFMKAVPIVGILPLGILLWGITIKMKVILIAFGIFWPLVIQTGYGLREIQPTVRDTATVFHLGMFRRIFQVALPSAAPFIATGLRLAAAGALVLDIAIEVVAGGQGIGVAMTKAEAVGATADMYALIVLTGAIGIVIMACAHTVEARVMHWHESQRQSAWKDQPHG